MNASTRTRFRPKQKRTINMGRDKKAAGVLAKSVCLQAAGEAGVEEGRRGHGLSFWL